MGRGLWVILAGLMLIAAVPAVGRMENPHDPPRVASGSDSPAVGTFVGWRDDFANTSKVGGSSNLVFSGGTARLPSVGTNLTRQGLVLGLGGPGAFDSGELGGPTVLFDQGIYKMWYFGSPGGGWSIGYATSPDGVAWTKQGVVLSSSIPQDSGAAVYPEVLKVGGGFYMWYSGTDFSNYRVLLATSPDGVTWVKQGVVLDVGPPGSLDDWYVYGPSVVFAAGTYYMWYVGQRNAGAPAVFLATSSNGIAWTRQGRVVAPGPIDSVGVIDPAVRLVGSQYEMLYCAVFPGGARLARATSPDRVAWTKLGYVLDFASPGETNVLCSPFIHVEPNSSWKVYYHARGGSLQIFLALRPVPGPAIGWLRSVPVGIPTGIDWAWFNQTTDVPSGSWLNVTVRDGVTGSPLAGLENLTAGSVDLASVDATAHPTLVFEGWFSGNATSSPTLDSWETTWTDRLPPTFAGLETTTDLGVGGSVRLTWSAGADPSPPITYSIYVARGTDPFSLGAPNLTTAATPLDVTGLTNGISYRFLVRASDAWANQETNSVTRTTVPTTPLDATPPVFAGLATATDARSGGAVSLTWSAASDPDTPASNSDPSIPIRYLAFAARTGIPFDFGTPAVVTTNLTAVVNGLTDGLAYDFLVRAVDAKGNAESNSVVRTATPTHPWDSVPPTFQGVDTVEDPGSGDRAVISWLPAADPDTPESNADPSLPITYSVWLSENATGLGMGAPRATTNATRLDFSGLRPGVTYYVLVRATDAAGNSDSNLRVVSFQIRQPAPAVSLWWIVLVILIVVVILGIVAWRRRKKPAAAPPSPPPA